MSQHQRKNSETDATVIATITTASRSSIRSNNSQSRSPNPRHQVANKVLVARSFRPRSSTSSTPAGPAAQQPRTQWRRWAWGLFLWIVWDGVWMVQQQQQQDHPHYNNYNQQDNDVIHVRRRAALSTPQQQAKTRTNHHSPPHSSQIILTQPQQQQQHVTVTKTALSNDSRKQEAMLQRLEKENETRQLEEAAAQVVDFLEHHQQQQHTAAVVPAITTTTTNERRPPLDSIVDPNTDQIIGDPEFLLDVAVIGFGKCGTSTMMDWIGMHPQVRVFPQEVWDLTDNQLPKFIRRLYTELEPGPSYLHGYKAPQDITQDRILDLYRQYWPHAKLIVGIRHPIPWFESFYNFRIQTVSLKNLQDFPAPEQFIGRPLCDRGDVRGGRRTCSSKGDFAYELLRLGKHNYPQPRLPSALEQSIVQRYANHRVMNFTAIKYMENPVLLFETEQLAATNPGRDQFRHDVSDFLGIAPVLGDIPHTQPGSAHQYSSTEQAFRNARRLRICDAGHAELRAALLHLARDTSRWLRESGVLDVPTVFVPQRAYFEERLLSWMEDPCDPVANNTVDAIE